MDASIDKGGDPYMQARVSYESRPLATMPTRNPGWIRAEAALRLTAIMQSLGMSTGNGVLDALLPILALIARDHFTWGKTPPSSPT